MDCTTCGPTPTGTARPDRPHTFFSHEEARCTGCGAPVLGRVVLRGDGVFRLAFCKQCGQREEKIADESQAYVDAFVAHGKAAENASGDHLFKHTTSTCPKCLALVDAKVV